MDYKSTIEFLYGLYRHGIKLGLESISTILHLLGNPHARYVSLHVGGTNGKGSTAAILASILGASGLRVGLYTSPHLVDFRERIRVNSILIPESRVIELTQQLQSTASSALTFFEFTTAMAFQYFADEQVDIAVVEVGMGGRFDATNVLAPLGVVITSIAHDHEQYLGHTLPEIAREKAGIIKHKTPVIVGAMPSIAEDIIRNVANDKQAPCYIWGSEFRAMADSIGHFHYHGIQRRYSDLTCALGGLHQVRNASCALSVLELIEWGEWQLQESAVRTGLSTVVWEGRVEILAECPSLLVDGAHNPAAATVLVEALTPLLAETKGQLILIVGMMKDKDHRNFLNVLCPCIRHLILTEVSVERAATVDELKQATPEGNYTLHVSSGARTALAIAERVAEPSDVICVTGSLFLVGEVKDLMQQSRPSCF